MHILLILSHYVLHAYTYVGGLKNEIRFIHYYTWLPVIIILFQAKRKARKKPKEEREARKGKKEARMTPYQKYFRYVIAKRQ